MKQGQKRAVREGQLERTLEKLFYRKKFIEEVEQLRIETGMPARGFKSFREYFTFLKRDLDEKRLLFVTKIRPATFQIAHTYGLPTNYAYWVEAFFALGFNYKQFVPETPYPHPREHFVYGASTALDTQTLREGYVSLHIFPGATLNATDDFLREHWNFIKSMLEAIAEKGKAPAVRKINSRDRMAILALADKGEINSMGVWVPGMSGEKERPPCLRNIGLDQVRKIVAEERRKKRLRERKPRK